jgi:type IV secretory pathway TraG/TraD family ATPase VirD4
MEGKKHFAQIGERYIEGGEMVFGLGHEDRRHHLYVIGQTGTGKTTLLRNLIIQDIAAGHGVGVIDPHGDLAHDLLDYIPRHRIEDVAFFNPADMEYPVGFNVLGSVPQDGRHLVASGMLAHGLYDFLIFAYQATFATSGLALGLWVFVIWRSRVFAKQPVAAPGLPVRDERSEPVNQP